MNTRKLWLIFPLAVVLLFGYSHSESQSITDGGDGTFRRIHVPILMYHYVSPIPADADSIRIGLTVEPEVFRAHLQYLRQEGYETISLYQLHQALNYGAELPPRPIILTFDDGYIYDYQYVFPMLQEFGYTGTFFIITGRADEGDPGYLSWDQIREMAQAGMSMEGHSRSHRDLRGRDTEYLIFEIVGSLESISAHTGVEARMFAYPAGRYDDDTLRVMNSSRVLRAVTTESGSYHTTDNAMEMTRLRVNGNLGVLGLENLLRNNQ